ncbi:DUF3267 domain-containing protein [Haloarcula onubensis]|uniref:DUF3267 domain-containing protein n=1 Tax=Haloarcula onubensis TaxID=2950539 RepID=A0ABU2FT42_9EURY|nr:DUF3267 domain-containing protein [Halomicroarcula sp. S3CR25-11]MDS0283594.1 DUF3267 domain-containing protein [Halomicroarcula sp. S3CR25-11]
MAADLPDSDHAPTETLTPATPDGYGDPTEFEYPLWLLVVGSVLLFPVATLLFGGVLWTVQGPTVFESLAVVSERPTGLTFVFRWPLIVGVTLLALGVTVVVHEFVHGLVFGRYGYRVSYGAMPQIGAFYATPFHQFVAREHVFPVALAPLVAISAVGVPLLAVPVPFVAFFVFQVLVVNAVGAVGDLYVVAYLLGKPEGTLLYDSDVRHSYVFEPR